MDPFRHNKRRTMTPLRVAKIYACRDGRCGILQDNGTWGDGCGWKFGVKGDYEIDHIIALSRGGEDVDEDNDIQNFQLLCKVCHGRKTGADLKEVGAIRRNYTRQFVSRKFRRSKAWR